MTLLKPILLLGAALAVVPLIIHFLNKTRYRVEPFGGMMFLRSAMRVRAQTLKLRQLLLLLLRCALFALLALSLARPVQRPEVGGAAGQPTTHLLILDGSLSMNQGEGADNAFHRAREAALRILDNMDQGDNMQVVIAGRKPRVLFPAPVFDRVYLQNELRNLRPGFDTVDVPRTFEQAFWALEKSPLPRHRIYFLTDGQRTGWADPAGEPWRQLGEHRRLLKVLPAAYVLPHGPDKPIDNVAVARIAPRSPLVDVFRQTTFICEIVNHSLQRRNVQVTFSVDGVAKAERALLLPPGSQEVHFDHLFDAPGSHYVTVDVSHDGLPADDRLTRAVSVVRQIPVLLIEGRSAENPWQSDGALLRLALEASGRPGERGLFAVDTLSQTQMDRVDIEYLRRYRAVILANLTSLSEFFTFSVERFVEQGGGILVAAGDQPAPAVYNRMYKAGKGVLPALLDTVQTYEQRLFQPTFPAGKASFVLDIFDLTRTRVLNEVKVQRYWRCQPAPEATVLATFGDDPFLVFKRHGQGRAILWATAVNMSWSNFPATQDFLPLVQNLAVFLSATAEPPINLTPGETLLYSSHRPLSGAAAEAQPSPSWVGSGETPPCTVIDPHGEKHELPLVSEGGEWLARFADTAVPGLYTVSAPQLPTRHFAVQTFPEESDLTAITAAGVERYRAHCPMRLLANEADLQAAIQGETGVRQWWQWVLLVTVALLCGELYLSWRFSK